MRRRTTRFFFILAAGALFPWTLEGYDRGASVCAVVLGSGPGSLARSTAAGRTLAPGNLVAVHEEVRTVSDDADISRDSLTEAPPALALSLLPGVDVALGDGRT